MKSAAGRWGVFLLTLLLIGGSYFYARHRALWRGERIAPRGVIETTGEPAPVPPSEPPSPAQFTLTDSAGQPFSSASLRGKVWVGSFFFTNCPGSCWKMNQKIKDLQLALKDADVQFVSISCDPDNDTPEALARYASHFGAVPGKWHFVVGDLKEVRRIGMDVFRVTVDRQTHADRLILVGKDGKVWGRYSSNQPLDMALLLKTIPKALTQQVDEP